jgi:hypothetical protein
MRVKMIFALAAFLFFVPAVSQAVTATTVVHLTGTAAKVKWQLKREGGAGVPSDFTLTATKNTIIRDPAATANATIDMDITDPMNHVINGSINVAGKENSLGLPTGGMYLWFSGNSLPIKNGSNKELFQGKVVLGYLLLDEGSAYEPPPTDWFTGTSNNEVAEFYGTVSAAVVAGKDRSGNPIWTISFTIYPNSAEIQYIIPDIGALTGPSTASPAILTLTVPPVRFTAAP